MPGDGLVMDGVLPNSRRTASDASSSIMRRSEDPGSARSSSSELPLAVTFLDVTSGGWLGRASWHRIMSIAGERRSTE